jgi:tetratricopeptide (TPR) repeat protein
VPESATRDDSTLQRRLLPHVQAFSSWIVKSEVYWWVSIDKEDDRDIHGSEEQQTVLDAIHRLGALYANQGKLSKAEHMYERALRGYEEALGSDDMQQYRPALNTLENIGDLYVKQAESVKA